MHNPTKTRRRGTVKLTWLLLPVMALLLVLAAACGDDEPTAAPTSAPTTAPQAGDSEVGAQASAAAMAAQAAAEAARSAAEAAQAAAEGARRGEDRPAVTVIGSGSGSVSASASASGTGTGSGSGSVSGGSVSEKVLVPARFPAQEQVLGQVRCPGRQRPLPLPPSWCQWKGTGEPVVC